MSSRLETLMESAWPLLQKAAARGLGPADNRPIAKLIPGRQLDPAVWKSMAYHDNGPVDWTDPEAWKAPRVDTFELVLSAEQLLRIEFDDALATRIETWAKDAANAHEKDAMQGLCRGQPQAETGSLEDQLRKYRNAEMASIGPFAVAAKPDTVQRDLHGITVVPIAPAHFPDRIDAVVVPRGAEGLRVEWGHNLELFWDRCTFDSVRLFLQARYRYAGKLGTEHLIRIPRKRDPRSDPKNR